MNMATHSSKLVIFGMLLAFSAVHYAHPQEQPQRPPKLIIDTDVAEGKEEEANVEQPKEYNPLLASQNLKVGNYYFKKRNYDAAIQRYLDAIGFQPNLSDAYTALARAYEKNGNLSKAIRVFKEFVQKNPDSPKVAEFQTQAEKLEKKQSQPSKD
jgi:pentatricopeptide repeat protein